MINTTQILLIVVVTTMTILLVVLGIQVYYILKETKKSLEKVNEILDNTVLVSSSIAKPVSAFSNSLSNLSGLTSLAGVLLSRLRKKGEDKENV